MSDKKPPKWSFNKNTNFSKMSESQLPDYQSYNYNLPNYTKTSSVQLPALQKVNSNGLNLQNATDNTRYGTDLARTITQLKNNMYQPSQQAANLTNQVGDYYQNKIDNKQFGMSQAEERNLANTLANRVRLQNQANIQQTRENLGNMANSGIGQNIINQQQKQAESSLAGTLTQAKTSNMAQARQEEAQTYQQVQDLSNQISARNIQDSQMAMQSQNNLMNAMRTWDNDTFNRNFQVLQQNNQNAMAQYEADINATLQNNNIDQQSYQNKINQIQQDNTISSQQKSDMVEKLQLENNLIQDYRNTLMKINQMNNQIEQWDWQNAFNNAQMSYNADAARAQASNQFTNFLIGGALNLATKLGGAAIGANAASSLGSSGGGFIRPSGYAGISNTSLGYPQR